MACSELARSVREHGPCRRHRPLLAATPAQDASGPQRIRKGRYEYQRRQPEHGALYRIVQDNLETLYAAVEEGFATASLPQFVRDEFERFLDCGLLCRGAALKVSPGKSKRCELVRTSMR
jgi:hypothetical protein